MFNEYSNPDVTGIVFQEPPPPSRFLDSGAGEKEKRPLEPYSPSELRQLWRADRITEDQWKQELLARGNSEQAARDEIARQKNVGVSTAAKTRGQLTGSEAAAVEALRGAYQGTPVREDVGVGPSPLGRSYEEVKATGPQPGEEEWFRIAQELEGQFAGLPSASSAGATSTGPGGGVGGGGSSSGGKAAGGGRTAATKEAELKQQAADALISRHGNLVKDVQRNDKGAVTGLTIYDPNLEQAQKWVWDSTQNGWRPSSGKPFDLTRELPTTALQRSLTRTKRESTKIPLRGPEGETPRPTRLEPAVNAFGLDVLDIPDAPADAMQFGGVNAFRRGIIPEEGGLAFTRYGEAGGPNQPVSAEFSGFGAEGESVGFGLSPQQILIDHGIRPYGDERDVGIALNLQRRRQEIEGMGGTFHGGYDPSAVWRGVQEDPFTGELVPVQKFQHQGPAKRVTTSGNQYFQDFKEPEEFGHGGKFVTDEPIFGVGAFSGDPQFVVGEAGPEMLDIKPMRRPFPGRGNTRRFQFGGSAYAGAYNPLAQKSAFSNFGTGTSNFSNNETNIFEPDASDITLGREAPRSFGGGFGSSQGYLAGQAIDPETGARGHRFWNPDTQTWTNRFRDPQQGYYTLSDADIFRPGEDDATFSFDRFFGQNPVLDAHRRRLAFQASRGGAANLLDVELARARLAEQIADMFNVPRPDIFGRPPTPSFQGDVLPARPSSLAEILQFIGKPVDNFGLTAYGATGSPGGILEQPATKRTYLPHARGAWRDPAIQERLTDLLTA